MNIIHPSTGKKALSIEEAVAALGKARERYDAAHAEVESARREETGALNALNDAQKAFDAAVNDMRGAPPWNSHWHSQTEAKSRLTSNKEAA